MFFNTTSERRMPLRALESRAFCTAMVSTICFWIVFVEKGGAGAGRTAL
jgi:hypothetical protein